MQDYFPSKLAQGTQFCNRTQEKAALRENMDKGRHTVLIAPRRYGKSSLVLKVVTESTLPLASVDLFLAHDDNAVIKRILVGIEQTISQILPMEQKVLAMLQRIFKHFRIALTTSGFSIETIMGAAGLDPVDQVFSALQGLAELAKEQKKKILFFIDEFQDIREAASAKSIQGAIRHIAQETSHIVFIFSGSNRRLLMELFDDRSKPLYMLCDMLHLDRMGSQDYLPHLQALAKAQWGQALPLFVFEKITALTELHPYYVNLLCHELWKLTKLPEKDDVFACWEKCYSMHEDRLISDLEKLTAKQQDILKALALHPAVEPSGQSFVSAAKTPASTINQALRVLLSKDMVYKVKRLDDAVPQWQLNQWRVLDPLLVYALKKYS